MSIRTAGDYFERQTRDALMARGWWVIRSAGSYGIADLVALKADTMPMLVSCKVGQRISRAERQQLLDVARQTGAMPMIAHRATRGKVEIAVLLTDLRMVHRETLKVPARPTRVEVEP